VAGEIAPLQEGGVADDQACCGLVGVDARGCSAMLSWLVTRVLLGRRAAAPSSGPGW
jgi:hypothetical protein